MIWGRGVCVGRIGDTHANNHDYCFAGYGDEREWTMSTKPDLFSPDTGLLMDYKTCKVFALKFSDAKKKWCQQLNIQADIIRRNGGEVKIAQNLLLIKDWNKQRILSEGAWYPKNDVVVLDQELWLPEDTEFFVVARCMELQSAIDAPTIDTVAACDPADRWERGEAWAVYKDNNKRATRVFDIEQDAKNYCLDFEWKERIEHKPATCNRCLFACDVAQWCPTWKGICDKQHQ